MSTSLNTIEEAIEDFRLGKFLIVVDDEDRENEGDFVCAAELFTAEKANFMARYGRGLICAPITIERCQELELDLMVNSNTSLHETPFTVSVDKLGGGCTTGISASDRAATVLAISDPNTKASDLGRPGHIFPLRAQKGGVLRRIGHTEAVVDLAKLAGLRPAGVLVEILNEDGTMARLPQLIEIAKEHKIKLISVKDLIAYRIKTETLVQEEITADLPTAWGDFNIRVFSDKTSNKEHIALTKGVWTKDDEPVLVRVHSSCATGDIFGSCRCDCGAQLHKAMEMVEKEGRGVILYMNQEGRGIGLVNKIKAYQLQDQGKDTVEANLLLGFRADERDYGIGAQILMKLGLRNIRLMSNNPAKKIGLEAYDLNIIESVPIIIPANEHNRFYLKTKQNKMGHKLEL